MVTPIKKQMPIEEATTKADEEGLPRVLAQTVSETLINVSQVEARYKAEIVERGASLKDQKSLEPSQANPAPWFPTTLK